MMNSTWCRPEKAFNVSLNGSLHPQGVGRQMATTAAILLLCLPPLLFPIRCIPLGSTMSVMLGASLLLLGNVVDLDDTLSVLSLHEALTILLFLNVATRIVQRENLVASLLYYFLSESLGSRGFVLRVTIIGFAYASLFGCDSAAILLAPLVVRFHTSQERPSSDLPFVLFALAASTNLGAGLFVTSSPVSAFIMTQRSVIPLIVTLLTARAILFSFLVLIFYVAIIAEVRRRTVNKSALVSEISQEMAGLTDQAKQNGNNVHSISANGDCMTEILRPLETIPEDGVLEVISPRHTPAPSELLNGSLVESTPSSSELNTFQVEYSPSALQRRLSVADSDTILGGSLGFQIFSRLIVYRSVDACSNVSSSFEPNIAESGHIFQTKSTIVLLSCDIILVIGASLTNMWIPLNLGMVFVFGITLLLLIYCLFTRKSCAQLFDELPLQFLLLFPAFAIISVGAYHSGLSWTFWKVLKLPTTTINSWLDLLLLLPIILLSSAIIGNVPFVMMFMPTLAFCQADAILLASVLWCCTAGANFSLFSSCSNLLITHHAGIKGSNPRLTYLTFLILGVPLTIATVPIGLLFINPHLLF